MSTPHGSVPHFRSIQTPAATETTIVMANVLPANTRGTPSVQAAAIISNRRKALPGLNHVPQAKSEKNKRRKTFHHGLRDRAMQDTPQPQGYAISERHTRRSTPPNRQPLVRTGQ